MAVAGRYIRSKVITDTGDASAANSFALMLLDTSQKN
jgi:hypothetical protein